jgi:hypothetical protein
MQGRRTTARAAGPPNRAPRPPVPPPPQRRGRRRRPRPRAPRPAAPQLRRHPCWPTPCEWSRGPSLGRADAPLATPATHRGRGAGVGVGGRWRRSRPSLLPSRPARSNGSVELSSASVANAVCAALSVDPEVPGPSGRGACAPQRAAARPLPAARRWCQRRLPLPQPLAPAGPPHPPPLRRTAQPQAGQPRAEGRGPHAAHVSGAAGRGVGSCAAPFGRVWRCVQAFALRSSSLLPVPRPTHLARPSPSRPAAPSAPRPNPEPLPPRSCACCAPRWAPFMICWPLRCAPPSSSGPPAAARATRAAPRPPRWARAPHERRASAGAAQPRATPTPLIAAPSS